MCRGEKFVIISREVGVMVVAEFSDFLSQTWTQLSQSRASNNYQIDRETNCVGQRRKHLAALVVRCVADLNLQLICHLAKFQKGFFVLEKN
jgi:hypothetical protein